MPVVYTNEREKAKRALAEMLGQHSEGLLPLLELVQELKVTLDDVFGVVGRVCVERVLQLSAEQVAGPRHQGKARGEVRWHGTQDGVVALSTQKIRVKKPRLRKKSGGKGAEVPIPAYEAMQRDGGLREKLAAVMLRGVSTRNYAVGCTHPPSTRNGGELWDKPVECESRVHQGERGGIEGLV